MWNCAGSDWELIFPTAAHVVLCSALVARTAPTSPQHYVHCSAALAQHQDSFQAPQGQQAGVGKRQGEDTARAADQSQPKG